MTAPAAPDMLHLASCSVDLRRDRVLRDGKEVVLTTLEADLLRYVSTRPSQPISADDLLTEVWGYRAGVRSRAVANTVSRLRAKVEADPSKPRHLITLFGKADPEREPQGAGGSCRVGLAAPTRPEGRWPYR